MGGGRQNNLGENRGETIMGGNHWVGVGDILGAGETACYPISYLQVYIRLGFTSNRSIC